MFTNKNRGGVSPQCGNSRQFDSGKVLRMTPFEILENNFYTGCSNGKKKKLKRKDVLGNVSGPLTLYRD